MAKTASYFLCCPDPKKLSLEKGPKTRLFFDAISNNTGFNIS